MTHLEAAGPYKDAVRFSNGTEISLQRFERGLTAVIVAFPQVRIEPAEVTAQLVKELREITGAGMQAEEYSMMLEYARGVAARLDLEPGRLAARVQDLYLGGMTIKDIRPAEDIPQLLIDVAARDRLPQRIEAWALLSPSRRESIGPRRLAFSRVVRCGPATTHSRLSREAL